MKRLHIIAATLAVTAATSVAFADDTPRRGELFRPGAEHAAKHGGHKHQPAPAGGPTIQYGDFSFDPGTKVAEAREHFARGLAQLWGFNHAAAAQSFRAAQAADPSCSACFWGEAYALGPNLNDGMHAENEAPARKAAARAIELAETSRDKLFAAAVAARHDASLGERAARNQAFAEAMDKAARRLPDDVNAQVILADALMNLQPWDYWEADGTTPKGGGARILAALEGAMKLDPDHPGALHLYIHAVEASKNPGRAEAAADRLRGAVPMAGHLAHMPAHIYTRVGRYADSIAVNKEAIAADEAFLAAAGEAASPLYRYGYYPHNVHFLLVAAQMAGMKETALEAADKLSNVTSIELSGDLAWIQAIETAPYAAHAQLSEPETILNLPDPGDRYAFVKGHWHWARGTALALKGDVKAAKAEADAIADIIAEADLSGLEEQFLPARNVLSIARHLVEARIAQAGGDWETATRHLTEAIELEGGIGYMEPPYWSYPVAQTLGALRLQASDPSGARKAFKAALATHPNNAWALWGLWQVEKVSGDRQSQERAADAFRRAWLGDGEPAINRL